MFEYQKDDCDLTMSEGLQSYYDSFPESKKIFQDNPESGNLLRDHDCTHVIFGLDISIEQEASCSMDCLLYTSPSPRDGLLSRMPSSA